MQVLKDDVRRRILNEAEAMFFEKGYAGASMRAIAQRADVTVGNIYRYYENKEALFGAIVDETYEALLRVVDLDDVITGFNTPAGYRAVKKAIIEPLSAILEENRVVALILLEGAKGTRYEDFKESYIHMIETKYLRIAIKALRESGTLIDDKVFPKIIARGCFEAMVEVTKKYTEPLTLKQHMNWVLDFYLKDLTNRFETPVL